MGTVCLALKFGLLSAAALCAGEIDAFAATGTGSANSKSSPGAGAAAPIVLAQALSPRTNLRPLSPGTGIAAGARVQSLQGLRAPRVGVARKPTGATRTVAPTLGSNRSFDIDRRRIDNLGLNAGQSDGLKQDLPARLGKKRLKAGAPDTEIARKRQVEPARIPKTKEQETPPVEQAARVAVPKDAGKAASKSPRTASAGSGRIPGHTPEWTNLVVSDPGVIEPRYHIQLERVLISSYQTGGSAAEGPMSRGILGGGPAFRILTPAEEASGEIPEYFEDLSCAACGPVSTSTGGLFVLPEVGDQVLVVFSGGTAPDSTPIIAYSHEVVSPRDATSGSRGAAADSAGRARGFGFVEFADGDNSAPAGRMRFGDITLKRGNAIISGEFSGNLALEPDGLVGPKTSGPLPGSSAGVNRTPTAGANETISVGGNATENAEIPPFGAGISRSIFVANSSDNSGVRQQQGRVALDADQNEAGQTAGDSASPSTDLTTLFVGEESQLKNRSAYTSTSGDEANGASPGANASPTVGAAQAVTVGASQSNSGLPTGKRQHMPSRFTGPVGGNAAATGGGLRSDGDLVQGVAGASAQSSGGTVRTFNLVDSFPQHVTPAQTAGSGGQTAQNDQNRLEFLRQRAARNGFLSQDYLHWQQNFGQAGQPSADGGPVVKLHLTPRVNRIEMSALPDQPQSPDGLPSQSDLARSAEQPAGTDIGIETVTIVHEAIEPPQASGQVNQSDLEFSSRLLQGSDQDAGAAEGGESRPTRFNYRPQFYYRSTEAAGADRTFKFSEDNAPLPVDGATGGDVNRPFVIGSLYNAQDTAPTSGQSLYFPEVMLREIQEEAGLPGNRVVSGLKSNSSPGSGSGLPSFTAGSNDLPLVVVRKVTVRGWDPEKKEPVTGQKFEGHYYVEGATHVVSGGPDGSSAAAGPGNAGGAGQAGNLAAHELAHVWQNSTSPGGPVPIPYPTAAASADADGGILPRGRPLLIIAEDVEGENVGIPGIRVAFQWTR